MNDRTNYYVYLNLCLFVIISVGCSFTKTPIVFSKPSISESTIWKLTEECGYEGCYPLVDFIEGPDVRIRIEVSNGKRAKGAFTTTLFFIIAGQDLLTISPSKIYVEFSDGNKFYAKPFKCGSLEFHDYLQRIKYIEKTGDYSLDSFNFSEYYRSIARPMPDSVSITESYPDGKLYRCVTLFFDTPPPSEDIIFQLIIQGVEKFGKEIMIPRITFRPSYDYSPKRRGRPIKEQ